jgi:hypothetical protein
VQIDYGVEYGIDAPLSRHVLLHFHLFKNGGSTIETILEREFRSRFATVHTSEASSVLDGHDIAAFLGAHPNIAALSSHHVRYPLPSIRRTVFDCCFLRHPLDRLQSVYTFMRTRGSESEDPILILARTAGPREFMIRLMDESPHLVGNAQAEEILRRMPLPGRVGIFDESLVAAEHFLGPAFAELRTKANKRLTEFRTRCFGLQLQVAS